MRGGDSQVFTSAQGLPGNSIWSIYQDRSDRLWVVTSEGLALYTGGSFKAYTANEGTPVSSGGIVEDRSGTRG